ncbi:FAD binding domain-containing protein [Rhodococcus rhodochrous]|uniref:FAD binding domain-containing protein n=1 Tax=Rhodococcus rhodochrous TaxID=1829 RepID=UPI0032E00310
MKAPAFAYEAPGTAREVVALLQQHGEDAKILAGGQSLLPVLALRMGAPTALIDLNGVSELAYHHIKGDELAIGALCRHREIELDPRIADRAPVVIDAVRQIGHVAIRNRGTVCGSLAHADSTAEWAVLALLLDARLVALGPTGTRIIRAQDFFQGFFANALREDELLVEARFTLPEPGSGTSFVELARRHGDFAIASAGCVMQTECNGRITAIALAASGAASSVVRLTAVEEALIGEAPSENSLTVAAELAAESAEPTPDLHGDVTYRRHLIKVVVGRALTRAAQQTEIR